MGTALTAVQRTGPLTEEEEDAAWFVCNRVLLGESLKKIELEGGPSQEDFYNLLRRSPTLVHVYNQAREISSFAIEDRIFFLAEELADMGSNNPNEIRRKTAYLEVLKWLARVRNPQVFGDKALVQVTVPVQINTNMDLGEQDAAKGTGHVYQIQAKPIRALRPEEVPAGHTVVGVGEGYVSIVPEEDAGSVQAAADGEEEGQVQLKQGSVVPQSAEGGAAEAGSEESPAAPPPKHSPRPTRASRVSKRKASPMEGEGP